MDKLKTPHINMEEIEKYIEQMSIKKAFHGFDRMDVYDKMVDIQNMFQHYIDAYDKILEEYEATISKLSSQAQKEGEKQKKSMDREKELNSHIEGLKQELSQMDVILQDLKLKLQKEKEEQIKLNQALNDCSKLLQKYRSQESKSKAMDESIQRAHIRARSIIEQAKIDAELEFIEFREKQRSEQEKHETWKRYTETASQEIFGHFKQVVDCVASLEETLREHIPEDESYPSHPRKVEEDPGNPQITETIWGAGDRLNT